MNVLRYLRWLLAERAGAVGLDGNTNVVGPTDAVPNIEGLCLDIVRECVAFVVAELSRMFHALSQAEGAVIFIQIIEATRDVRMTDAPGKAHRIMAANIRARMFVDRTVYEGNSKSELAAGAATVRAYRYATGAALKGYAKLADLYRLEWAADNREAIRRESCADYALMSGDGAAGLVRQTLAIARPELLAFEAEVMEIARSDAAPVDVAIALAPLLLLVTSDMPVRGPQPLVPVRDAAARAYNSLLLTGQCTLAPGAPVGRLRECLDTLRTSGCLVRAGHRLCYALAPRLAAAMALPASPGSHEDVAASNR